MALVKLNTSKFAKQNFQRRLTIAVALIVLLIAVLLGRLVYLQIHEYHRFQTLSEKNSINLVPIPPTRGLIYDHYGKLIAENIPVFSLDIIPNETPNLAQTLKALIPMFGITNKELKEFNRLRLQRHRYDKIPLKIKLTPEQIAEFYVNQFQLPGVKITAQLIRNYPFSNDLVDVLGYTSRIDIDDLDNRDASNYAGSDYIGKRGIENYFETELHGKTGYRQVEVNAVGQDVRVLSTNSATPGDNLYLTIDTDLQKTALKAFGDNMGSLVAINPQNGNVLAMVSTPSYNPNLFVRGISHADYDALRTSPDRPLFNRVFGLYPPGSTIKPFMALQGLATGTVTTNDWFFDPGYFQIKPGSRRFRNWKRSGQGRVNITAAITISNDTFFYRLGLNMGIKNIEIIERKFGFGQKTGIQLPHEPAGIVPGPAYKMKVSHEPWYPGDTLNSSIGQGYTLVTPLQLAVATSIIAARGVHYKPNLILKTKKPNGDIIMHQPEEMDKVDFPDSIWNTVIKGMVDVIVSPRGTGYRFGDPPYSVAAKTGTAQLFTVGAKQTYAASKTPKRLRDNSMFIAFAPVEHPKIAVAVAVQNAPVAASIAREVMDYYLLTQEHLNGVQTLPH